MVKTFAILSLLLSLSSARAQQQNQDTTTAQAPQGSMDWVQENSGTMVDLGFFLSYPSPDTIYTDAGGSNFESVDGGTDWRSFLPPIPGLTVFYDAQNGYDVSESGGTAYYTSNGGQSWSSANDSMPLVAEVDPISRDTAFLISGDNNRIGRSIDGGKSWTLSNPEVADLLSIAFADSKHGIAVGTAAFGPQPSEYGASCVTTNDGGITWIQQYIIASDGLDGVTCVNKDTFIAIGRPGYVHRSTDGGGHWDTIPTPSQGFFAIASKGGRVITVGNSSIYTSTDGGLTWQPEQSGVTAGLSEVAMYDNNSAIVVGSGGTVLKTTNGGSDWVQESPPSAQTLQSKIFPDPSNGVLRISYTLPQLQDVNITIYDVTGKLIATPLVKQLRTQGQHFIPFDGINYPAGVYNYQIQTERYHSSGKFTIVK